MSSLLKDSPSVCKICIDDPNFPLEKHLQLLSDLLRKFGLSPAILSVARVIPPHLKKPEATDLITIAGEDYIKYPKALNSQRLTAAALEAFTKADASYSTELIKAVAVERALIKDVLSTFSDEVLMNFNRIPESIAALEANDIYMLWPLFVRAWSGEGASRAAVYLDRAVTVKQLPNETHLKYSARITEIFRVFLQQFEDKAKPGYINSDKMTKHLYLRGLDPVRHTWILQKILSENIVVTRAELMSQVQTFVGNFSAADVLTEPIVAYAAKPVVNNFPAVDKKSGVVDRACIVCGVNFTPARHFFFNLFYLSNC